MIGPFSQVSLLLWKNFTAIKRKPMSTLFECLVPTIFPIALLVLKLTSNHETKPAIVYPDIGIFHAYRMYGQLAPIYKELGYFPRSNATDDVMKKIVDIHNKFSPQSISPKGFSVEGEAVAYLTENNKDDMAYIIEFHNVGESTAKLSRTAKMTFRPYRKINQIWDTANSIPFEKRQEPRQDQSDYVLGYLQTLLGRAVMQHWKEKNGHINASLNFNISLQRFPSPAYAIDGMYDTISTQLTLFHVLAFMLIAFSQTKSILQEKEMKIKESMKLMGLKMPAYWTSWFITFFIFMLPTLVAFTVIFGVDIDGKGAILAESDPSIMFVCLLCYSFAVISFSFMVSCFAQKGNDGMIAAGLLFLMIYIPYEILKNQYQKVSKNVKLFACILFNVALGLSCFNIVRRESIGEGMNWNNWDEPLDDNLDEYEVTLAEVLAMLMFDTALHLLVTWYVDNVYPGNYGVPKPFTFFLQKSYWLGRYRRLKDQKAVYSEDNSEYLENIEPFPSSGHTVGIEIINLTKNFGDKISVKDLKLKMYEGHITVLLGHNGAGKTTTMSMLTGFIPPSDGTAIVNGKNIKWNIDGVRKSLGLCPQHDILFDSLSPYEHIYFFSNLKGYKSSTLHEEIKHMLKEVGLETNTTMPVSKLSAGQKRSLSVGVALFGDSKVVILDEPSSGMDPSTRRHTWDVLRRYREGRTLLLSTHYMDEADALGDRIAIMAEGELQCCGSSLFLKKMYGAGYHLVIECLPHCNIRNLSETVFGFVTGSHLESVVRSEVSYLLPDTSTAQFPALLRHLDDNKSILGILNFGTNTTTMEEVFLKSERGKPKPKAQRDQDFEENDNLAFQSMTVGSVANFGGDVHKECNVSSIKYHTGPRLWYRQAKAIIWKHYVVAMNNKVATLFSYLLPGILLVIYLLIENAALKISETAEIEREYNLEMYESQKFKSKVLYKGIHASPRLVNEYTSLIQADGGETIQIPDTVTNFSKYILELEKHERQYTFDRSHIIGAIFRDDFTVSALYNAVPNHGLFVSIGVALNALARHYLNDDSYSMTFSNHPIDKPGDSELHARGIEIWQSSFYVGLFIGMGYTLYASLAVHHLLKEKLSGVKHMHALFGVSMMAYWIPTFLWDAFSFVVPTILVFIVIEVGELEPLGENWVLVIVVVVLFIWASLQQLYAVHFLFETPSQGLIAVVIMTMFSALLSDIIVFEFVKYPTSNQATIGEIISWVFSAFIPAFNLSQCFGLIYRNYYFSEECTKGKVQAECAAGVKSLCCVDHPQYCTSSVPGSSCFKWSTDYYDLDRDMGIGTYMYFMVIQGFLGAVMVVVIEMGLGRTCHNSCYPPACGMVQRMSRTLKSGVIMINEDDVKKESTWVDASANDSKSLMLVKLAKQYGYRPVVRGVSVGVTEGECFGLLGGSGAGKTTILRMLTGQTRVTSGNAYLFGHSVRTSLNTVQSYIGYCPQFDALIPDMTAYEILAMYAMLRGVPKGRIQALVQSLVDKVLLGTSAHRRCGTYSGGNKRKLSLAMALVGSPPFLFLDEPSSGMDPKARRQMWNVLSEIRASGCTIVLTSHSMEECDALCTNLAIIFNGEFLCLGSPHHLKCKYGQGYTLIAKMGQDEDGEPIAGKGVFAFVAQHIPNTIVFDEFPGYLHLHIPSKDVHVADVFSVMEQCKRDISVEDYSVHETTLEQIFLTFTQNYHLARGEEEEQQVFGCFNLQSGFFGDNVCFGMTKSPKSRRVSFSKTSEKRGQSPTPLLESGETGSETESCIKSYAQKFAVLGKESSRSLGRWKSDSNIDDCLPPQKAMSALSTCSV